mgnify:CR=1 FL=1
MLRLLVAVCPVILASSLALAQPSPASQPAQEDGTAGTAVQPAQTDKVAEAPSGPITLEPQRPEKPAIPRSVPYVDYSGDLWHRPALTGDVIVGFPGETEEDFEATCRAVEAAGFSKVHVFRFSPRPGTPAAAMPRHTPERVVHQRAGRLERIGRALRQRFLEGLVGETLEVLLEEPVPRGLGRVRGTCRRYAPVELPAEAGAIGRLVVARAVEACGGRLIALP